MITTSAPFFISLKDIKIESSCAESKKDYCGAEPGPSKPSWLKVRVKYDESFLKMQRLMGQHSMHTVCEEAKCPNISECWGKGHATVMILGKKCTRACAFCNVDTGVPTAVDDKEPAKVAELVRLLNLRHVVITSVDRDDLPDGGASQFAACIRGVRAVANETTVEVLTPDFIRKGEAYKAVLDEKPDVFNHNIETVARLYPRMKQGARYFHSLHLLYLAKQSRRDIFTKSGIIVGLGETDDELFQTMDDLRAANVDFLTVGQYLQPSKKHVPVDRYVTPDNFELYKKIALAKGFSMVASSPLTRSSYHADDDFQRLKSIFS